jgi:hypothetical protein
MVSHLNNENLEIRKVADRCRPPSPMEASMVIGNTAAFAHRGLSLRAPFNVKQLRKSMLIRIASWRGFQCELTAIKPRGGCR